MVGTASHAAAGEHAHHAHDDRPSRVLVLLASRNGEAAIERQIDSVLAQEGVDVLLDVRDDGSTDGTADHVARLAAGDVRVRLSPDRTPSGSAAGNFFALMSAARLDGIDHVALCDQDDEWWPGKLRRAVDRLRNSGCCGYSSAVRAVWPDGSGHVLAQNTATSEADFLFEGAGQGCTFVLAVDAFASLQRHLDAAGALLEQVHYHDWLVYASTRASGGRWHFDPEPTMTYRQHADNDTGARTSYAGVARRLRWLRDGWYRSQVVAVATVIHHLYPENVPAADWLALLGSDSRWRRFVYIARCGRRRPADRLIQLVAVALGYL